MKRIILSFTLLFTVCLMGTGFLHAQTTVSGMVKDAATGEALIGAGVAVKGTVKGTITDVDGNYVIKANSDEVLVFSYLGYEDLEIPVGNQTTIDAQLSAGKLLDEVVVVGYGSVPRSDLTGSVASLATKDFNGGLVVSSDQLIQGRAAGIQVINNSGQPGGQTTFRIRGNSSLRTGNDPLFVVDGIPFSGASSRPGADAGDLGAVTGSNPLNFINPQDIESIQVLKDASAAAIYGSRGANGVVLISTKKGKTGDPSITVSSTLGFSNILKRYDVLDGDQYRDALKQYELTNGDYGSNVNALNEILQTGVTNNHNISIGAGNQNGNYRISLGYLNQQGIIKQSGFNRLNASVTGNYKFLQSKKLNVDYLMIASRAKEDGAPVATNSGFQGNVVGAALQWNPTAALYDADGNPVIYPPFGNTSLNPVVLLNAFNDHSNTLDVFANIAPSYKFNDNFTYRFAYGINIGSGTRKASLASYLNLPGIENEGLASVQNKNLFTQVLTHSLTFDKKFGSTNVNAVVGYEYQKFDESGTGIAARGFITDDFDYTSILQNSKEGSRNIFGFALPVSELQSYFGRVNFNLKDKYLITATVRSDGSSKFGSNNRYATFPSVAFAWNLHNESFLADGMFNNLKLRLGWGKTGNSSFPAGAALDRFRFGTQTIIQDNVGNPDLKWETTTTFNVGLDFAIWDYKLSGSVEYFNRNTEDLLFNFATIQPAPATRYWINLPGNVINSGVELSLNSELINRSDFRFDVGANLTFLKNTLENYTGPNLVYGQLFGQGISGATIHRFENGQPLHSFYTRGFLGLNSEGISDYEGGTAETLAFRGNPNPTTLLGFTTNLEYKKLTFTMNFNGAFGNVLYNNTKNTVLPITNLGTRNIDASLIGGDVLESTANAIKSSDRYFESGNYVKLANATIAYNFGSVGKNLRNLRLFVTGQNLLLFTKYSGFDPEVNTVNDFNGIPSFGIEYIPYPSSRTILFGLNFSL